MWLSMYWQKWNTHIKYKNVECKIWNTKYKNRKWKNEKMKTSTGSSTLTWMQDFLCFRMTRTERGVELEMVDVVEESWTHREEDVLKVKVEMKVKICKQVEFENSFEWKWVQLKMVDTVLTVKEQMSLKWFRKKWTWTLYWKWKWKWQMRKWTVEMKKWILEIQKMIWKWNGEDGHLKVKVKKLNWRTRLNEMHMI